MTRTDTNSLIDLLYNDVARKHLDKTLIDNFEIVPILDENKKLLKTYSIDDILKLLEEGEVKIKCPNIDNHNDKNGLCIYCFGSGYAYITFTKDEHEE